MCIIKTFFGICPNESLVYNNKGNPLLKKNIFLTILEMRHSVPKKILIKINKGIPLFLFRLTSKCFKDSYLLMKNLSQSYLHTYAYTHAYNKKLCVR